MINYSFIKVLVVWFIFNLIIVLFNIINKMRGIFNSIIVIWMILFEYEDVVIIRFVYVVSKWVIMLLVSNLVSNYVECI